MNSNRNTNRKAFSKVKSLKQSLTELKVLGKIISKEYVVINNLKQLSKLDEFINKLHEIIQDSLDSRQDIESANEADIEEMSELLDFALIIFTNVSIVDRTTLTKIIYTVIDITISHTLYNS